MSDYSTLLTEVSDKVATIWLNRPEKGNAFSPTLSRELYEALEAFEADDDIRAIVVTGSGKFFSTGADLSEADAVFDDAFDSEGRYAQPMGALANRMRTPIIAAMNGSGVGAGLTIPLCWDIRFAAEDAKYGFLFVRRGLIPDLATTWSLPRLIGMSRAIDLLMTGRVITGREAAEMGLVTAALPADEVLAAAQSCARDIAENTSGIAVAATKSLIYAGAELSKSDASDREARTFLWLTQQADAAEGVKAFMEKRNPAWPTPKSLEFPPGHSGS